MTPSTNLFEIIHSLTPTEKRYFRMFSTTHVVGNKNNYARLFDAYCDLPAGQPYDEAAFKKKLATKTWGKNFAVEKKVLEDQLMKAMRAYNAERTAEGALNDVIANIHFLYNKGLFTAANKELEKGISIANDLENLPGLIILYQLKLNLTRITQTPADIKTANEDLEAETRILTMLDTERKIVHARRKIYNLKRSGQLKENMAEAKNLVDELEHLETGQTLTYKARVSLFFSRALIAESEGLYGEAMQLYEQANAIWKKNELKLHESYSNLRTILSNYLACAHHLERHDVYPDIIKQIEGFPVESIKDEVDTFVAAKGAWLLYLLNTTDKSGATELIKDIEQGLKKFKSQISREQIVEINTNICFIHFQTQRYAALIDSLNHTFNLIGRDEKMHLQAFFLKFLEIMAHFSIKNYDLLKDSYLRNTERWLREHELNHPFTDLLLKSFLNMRTEPQYTQIKNQLSAFACPGHQQMLKTLVLDWMAVNSPLTSSKQIKQHISANPVLIQTQSQ